MAFIQIVPKVTDVFPSVDYMDMLVSVFLKVIDVVVPSSYVKQVVHN